MFAGTQFTVIVEGSVFGLFILIDYEYHDS
jgi:hypothetical protein